MSASPINDSADKTIVDLTNQTTKDSADKTTNESADKTTNDPTDKLKTFTYGTGTVIGRVEPRQIHLVEDSNPARYRDFRFHFDFANESMSLDVANTVEPHQDTYVERVKAGLVASSAEQMRTEGSTISEAEAACAAAMKAEIAKLVQDSGAAWTFGGVRTVVG